MDKNIFNTNQIKKQFPIFANNPELVYLDSAATSQKPKVVIDAVTDFYEKYNANIHRGIYSLSQKATDMYEETRNKAAKFVGAQNALEIVFSQNTNTSINLIAKGWGEKNLKPGDIVVLSELEHHANVVPWIKLSKEKGIKLFYIPVDEDFRLDYQKILTSGLDIKKIKLVSLTHASNVTGTINPIQEIIKFLKTNNIQTKVAVDAAQSAPHLPINVQNMGCDFVAFSSHKMFGPSGVGVLWARSGLLAEMDPVLVGSQMIKTVSKENYILSNIPERFEVGTPNLEGVVGLGAAIDFIESIGRENIAAYEEELTKYGLDVFKRLGDAVNLYGPRTAVKRLGIFSFTFNNVHAHDVAEILNRNNICVRSGHHCAQIILEKIKQPATARASVSIYNSKEDLDKLANGLEDVKKILKI
ncbi:MAG TPA: SufS family cysteine desulfurase [Patescibacteria group bacterium]